MVEGNLPHHCKTFLAAISHCPFREQTPRCFALIAIAIGILPAAHPRTKFAGDTPRNCVPHHTFGLLSVPGAVLPFFMFMWQKVPNPIPCGKATFASASSCYSTFFFLFRGGSLKCSHIWQISIITPRTRSCCASIFVIYSWWYCTKYIRLPFYTPSEDSVFFFLFLFLLRCRSLLPIQLLIRQCYLTAAKVRPTCPVVLSSFSRDSSLPPQKKKQPFHPLLRRREWLSILESSGLRRGDSG